MGRALTEHRGLLLARRLKVIMLCDDFLSLE